MYSRIEMNWAARIPEFPVPVSLLPPSAKPHLCMLFSFHKGEWITQGRRRAVKLPLSVLEILWLSSPPTLLPTSLFIFQNPPLSRFSHLFCLPSPPSKVTGWEFVCWAGEDQDRVLEAAPLPPPQLYEFACSSQFIKYFEVLEWCYK